MSDSTNKTPRFAADFFDGRPCIRDNEKARVATFEAASHVTICLDEIALKGLDPEHLSWIETNQQPELTYAENPS